MTPAEVKARKGKPRWCRHIIWTPDAGMSGGWMGANGAWIPKSLKHCPVRGCGKPRPTKEGR